MNKNHFISTFMGLCVVVLASLSALGFIESQRLKQIHIDLSTLGYEVLELRDKVTQTALDGPKNPYHLTRQIVTLEKENSQLKLLVDAVASNALLWHGDDLKRLFEQFNHALLINTGALDHLIGLIVVEASMLESLHQQFYIQTNMNAAIEEQLILLSALSTESQTQQLLQTLQTVKDDKTVIMKRLLGHQSSSFVEVAEHQMMAIVERINQTAFQYLFAALAIVIVFVAVQYWSRLQELKKHNHQYRQAVAKAQKANQAKSLFLATMSHELRTPMNGVLGMAQIVISEIKDPVTKSNIQVIIDSGEHLLTLLNDILDFSKVEQGKMELNQEYFSLAEVLRPLEQTMSPLAEQKNLNFFIINQTMDSHLFFGDASRLRQCLFNLVGNAIKFTEQGQVKVLVEACDITHQGISFSVIDTGIGIAPEKLADIFSPFEQAELSTTRNFGGTGLGLAIVKFITDLMGGSISVKSQPQQGSCFKLDLPLKSKLIAEEQPQQNPLVSDQSTGQETPKSTSIPQIQEQLSTPPLNILVVEDNPINALVAKKMLSGLNHQVTIAPDGLVALSTLKHQQFDLMIIDNHMPNLSGIDTIKAIRNELKLDTVVFAYTADVFKEAHDDLLRAGAHYVLTKPLQNNSLDYALERFLPTILKQQISNAEKTTDNVIPLIRLPIEKLPLTEEEVSQSSIFTVFELCDPEKIELLVAFEELLKEKSEQLIAAYESSDTVQLHAILHTLKGTALEFNMVETTELAKRTEATTKSGELPDVDDLQKLLNRLVVNQHQAQRMLEQLMAKQPMQRDT